MARGFGLLALVWVGGCSAKDPDLQATISGYARVAELSYVDTLAAARALDAALVAFVAAPSASTLAAAKSAWLDAREPYGQTEVFRFQGGPIDDDDGPEGLINAWPLDEAYIDYVDGDADAGIIQDPEGYPVIDAAVLSAANQPPEVGETSVSTGYHAVEFLLWGQDTSDTGPGDRPHTDFLAPTPHAERRGTYLTVTSAMLVGELRSVADEWAPGTPWRSSFEADPEAGIAAMLKGMAELSRGELAGERITVALDTREQEDEHSCFSDNTHRDTVTAAIGIRNAWRGEYVAFDGTRTEVPGLRAVAEAVDAELAARLDAQMDASVAAAEEIGRFDQEIRDEAGRSRLQAVVDSLDAQTDDLVSLATALGIVLNVE
jgi:putative iron-regulated protein